MKSILDPSFQYTPAVATNIMERFKANGLVPRKQPMTEIERLRKFRKDIEDCAYFHDGAVSFAEPVFLNILSECDGANEH